MRASFTSEELLHDCKQHPLPCSPDVVGSKAVSGRSHFLLSFFLLVAAPIVMAQGVAITTHHYDNFRTGWNNQETVLTPASVSSPSFGMLFSVPIDSQVDAQPLVIPGVEAKVKGAGEDDVVYVASEGNTVYAIDSDSGEVLLSANFGPPVAAPPSCPTDPVSGINSTPVIDQTSSTMYVMVYTADPDGPAYYLHALDLATLIDKVAPVLVSASHTLTDGSTYNFNALYEKQRPALLLANGNVYAGFGSFCDKAGGQTRGWLLGWQADSLTPLASNELFDTQASSPKDMFLSSIWMSGAGMAAGSDGSLYFVTANSDSTGGTYDGTTDIQESVLRVAPDLSQILDLFTPSDVDQLDIIDKDFGSGGITLIPEKPSTLKFNQPSIAVAAGKDGNMYVMDQHNLGGFSPSGNNVLGTYSIGNCFCQASYFVDPLDRQPRIVSSGGASVEVWQLQTIPNVTLTQVAASANLFNRAHGFFTAVSSNGFQNPIIWAISRADAKTSALNFYALDPDSGGGSMNQLYASQSVGTWPYNGNANIVPVVANGKVYIGSGQMLAIFGLSDKNKPLNNQAKHETTTRKH